MDERYINIHVIFLKQVVYKWEKLFVNYLFFKKMTCNVHPNNYKFTTQLLHRVGFSFLVL